MQSEADDSKIKKIQLLMSCGIPYSLTFGAVRTAKFVWLKVALLVAPALAADSGAL